LPEQKQNAGRKKPNADRKQKHWQEQNPNVGGRQKPS
jgi:hypothetical protein